MSDDEGGMLWRWSRRKAQARAGTVPAEPASVPVATATGLQSPVEVTPPPAAPLPPPPTLEDVAGLTHDSDFSRFVMPGVDRTVKNAAMKKLFSDPHFNVMDGLDTYIDDYGKPDPIPEAILRRMTQSKFLRLFDDDPVAPDRVAGAAVPAVDVPVQTSAPPLPHSIAPDSGDDAPGYLDEDTALRLQPDDAAGPAGTGSHRAGPRA